MGVIYKLKDDVINFILEQKRTNPALSCRKLVDIVQTQFSIKVSKSSINDIFKQAALSSPVGRRSSGEKTPKFKISDQKREQIFPAEKPIVLGYQAEPPRVAQAPPTDSLKKEKKEELPPSKISAPIPLEIKPTDEVKEKKPLTKSESVKKEKPVIKSPVYDCMGAFILKVAEGMVSDTPILSNIFNKVAMGFSSKDSHDIAEVLLYFRVFGLDRIEELNTYKGDGLWILTGVEEKASYWTLDNIIKKSKNDKNISILMSNETIQKFSEVNKIVITSSNKEEYIIDSNFYSFHKSYNVRTDISRPINYSLREVSNRLITNVNPLILLSIPGDNQLSSLFPGLLNLLNGAGNQTITSLDIYDNLNNPLVSFNDIPQKRRDFIFGAWPWQAEIKEITDTHIDGKTKDFLSNHDIFYTDLMSNLDSSLNSSNSRVILLSKKESETPYLALISNITAERASAEKIILDFLHRWPDPQGSLNHYLDLDKKPPAQTVEDPVSNFIQRIDNQGFYDLWDPNTDLLVASECFLAKLDVFCQRQFFPEECQNLHFSTMVQRFYGLPGAIIRGENTVTIELKIPEKEYPYQKFLEYALARVNEVDFHDPKGLRLVMKIS